MTLSNSLGSNTFDVLFCLGLPWLLKTLITGESLQMNSQGMGYSSFLLLANLIVVYAAIAYNGFVVNKQVSVLLFQRSVLSLCVFLTYVC